MLVWFIDVKKYKYSDSDANSLSLGVTGGFVIEITCGLALHLKLKQNNNKTQI